MSSLHNDLTTWAAKAKAKGKLTLNLNADLVIALGELVRAAGAVEQSLPAHWHDERLVELRDALKAAEKLR